MGHDDYHDRLREVKYTAGMNARYHQRLESRYAHWDRAVRIAVAVPALFGVIIAVPEFDKQLWGLITAVTSLVMAIALNVIPAVERAKHHGVMFRAWSGLRKAAVLAEHKTCKGIEDHHAERLVTMLSDMESLHINEPCPDVKLLATCQEDENEAEWGQGIRTEAQVETERCRRLAADTPAAAAQTV